MGGIGMKRVKSFVHQHADALVLAGATLGLSIVIVAALCGSRQGVAVGTGMTWFLPMIVALWSID